MFTELGFKNGEWAGIPIPIEGIDLVVEPSYPFAKIFHDFQADKRKKKTEEEGSHPTDGWIVRNIFYSGKLKCDVMVCQTPEGRIKVRVRPAAHSMSQVLATLFASDVWGVDQEQAALQTLANMLRHRQFKQYLLTGMFLERSKRSGVTYIFRRLRPTVALNAIRPGEEDSEDEAKILAALCMHPIAYYSGSWAGAMTPTDDIIAHLALMRGDEHMFWRRCNQHPAHRPEAGL
jgi:hypothetical protein